MRRGTSPRATGARSGSHFRESQKGEPKWDHGKQIVQENRTEALDLSRAAIRNRTVVLPRQCPVVAEFAAHMAADAKRLVEDEETGEQSYRYIRTGADHFSLAFTYDCIAALRDTVSYCAVSDPDEPFYHPVLHARW